MHPVFQASFLAGGIATCVQLPAVQLAGCGLQVLAAAGSSAVAAVQTKKYLKQANAEIFGPRGLAVRICATKTLMQAVGLPETKLSLPPPNDADGLEFGLLQHTTPSSRSAPAYEQGIPEDPRMRRLRALEGYVSHISFDESQEPQPHGALKRYITAPARWMNSRSERGLVKAREKGLEQQRRKAITLDEELAAANREIEELKQLAATQETLENQHLANQARSTGGSHIGHDKTASQDLAASLERRAQIIEEIKRAGAKKMKKSDKKEEKVANRIMWIVITRSDDAPLGHEEFVEISDEANLSSH
ncbi:hypothetical protein MPH_09294 [Macrophomina phaseolina MS6]|uniref:Uncharacterized protein n=1 Tax=Macrophomina phaseolina (strain MS6) TaxID=1126212 RepID=K2S9H1_MACPH|nr:hypothetical protein MPH_09294 [Macrophomina phaseolina MS6]